MLFRSQFIILLVEAKYFSSKSSIALDEAELEIAETASDQLAKEYLDLLESHMFFNIPKSKVLYYGLIYLTAHRDRKSVV